ncbi:MAG: hypothetical protein WEA29_05000 [Acidimicrobiia bacterium]
MFTGSIPLTIAGFLAIAIAVVHSYLGERYLIIRLLRRDDLPRLLGDDTFTRRVVRFAWHLTSIAWIGMGWALLAIAFHTPPSVAVLHVGPDLTNTVVRIIGVTFLISGVLTAAVIRLRHMAWVVFLAIGVLALVD